MELLSFGDTGWGDELLRATFMTILVAIVAFFFGFFISFLIVPLKLSKKKFLNFIGNTYTTIFRGVPELLVIYLFFFGGSTAVMFVAKLFGYKEFIEINAFLTGSVSIGLISGAYTTEVLRGAIESISRGQFDGAKSLGLKKSTYYIFVIAPQVLRLSLPNLSNVWQLTLKDTALISVTGLVEIMRQSYIASGVTRNPLLFYCFAAFLYLILTTISLKYFNKLEKKYNFRT
jgi:octopine/nopaline transport system permease protein|tara:strand:+ start:410 stop:1102 length:693 start_codon:yes stop_codon:yes gene_type:complete